jgi:hypothetical protein
MVILVGHLTLRVWFDGIFLYDVTKSRRNAHKP